MHEDSDEEVPPEDLDTEKITAVTEKGKGETKTKTSKKKLKTTLLVADAPVTLRQYQSTLKEKLEHLYGHKEKEKEVEQGEGPMTSASMTEDWVRVLNR